MMRVALATGLVVAVLAGLSLTACGGSDRLSAKDYRAELAVLTKQQDRAHADLEKLRRAESGAEIRHGLNTFAGVQQLLAGDMQSLKPPKNAEKANALLARGALDLRLEALKLVSGLPVSKSPKPALKRLNALGNARGEAEVARALGQLKKLGYIKEG